MTWPEFFLAAIIAAVTFTNVCILAVVMRQWRPRKVEVIVRSVFAGDVVQEERIVVKGRDNTPVELTFDLDQREKVKEWL
jgi:hypothetical protein